jgi:hypothetical protein
VDQQRCRCGCVAGDRHRHTLGQAPLTLNVSHTGGKTCVHSAHCFRLQGTTRRPLPPRVVCKLHSQNRRVGQLGAGRVGAGTCELCGIHSGQPRTSRTSAPRVAEATVQRGVPRAAARVCAFFVVTHSMLQDRMLRPRSQPLFKSDAPHTVECRCHASAIATTVSPQTPLRSRAERSAGVAPPTNRCGVAPRCSPPLTSGLPTPC